MPTDQLHKRREDAIEHISDAFAHDHLPLEEFEKRLAMAHRAADDAALADITHDLPARQTQAIATISPALPATIGPPTTVVRAVLGSVERRGTWTAPQRMETRALFGSVVLDYRNAVLSPGVNEVDVRAVFGSIEIIVPPTVAVTVDGGAILGSFEHIDRAPGSPAPDMPVLHIRGSAILGSIEVITRLPRGQNPKLLER